MGLTIDKHYCGSRLISISIVNESDTCCDPDDGCCQDVSDTYKLSADYTFTPSGLDFDPAPIILPALSFYYISSIDMGSTDIGFNNFIPPRSIKSTLSSFQTYRL
jgi:hypothetical protein